MWMTSDQRSDTAAMATLRQAMKDERRNQALISGDLPYSPYSPKRGEEESDDLNYERALNRVRSAESETAPVEARHTLARILLAMGGRENVRKALVVLDQIEAAGVQSPELLNDLGVARLQLGDYDAAANYFTRALEKSPGADVSQFNKALSEQKAGRVDEARHDWNQFISGSSDERLKAEARSQLDVLR
jgi:tetratricopeptide (TPR) repeat protein